MLEPDSVTALAARLEALGLSRLNLYEAKAPPELGSFALTPCLHSKGSGLEDENSSDTGIHAWVHALLDQVTVVKTLIWQVRALFPEPPIPISILRINVACLRWVGRRL
jgi:hypothetical protein